MKLQNYYETMKITTKLVIKIADLIKIHLEGDEITKIRNALKTALKPMEVLKELDTDNIQITSHTVGEKNVFRDDNNISVSLTNAQALKNANYAKDGYIIVKRVIK